MMLLKRAIDSALVKQFDRSIGGITVEYTFCLQNSLISTRKQFKMKGHVIFASKIMQNIVLL